PPLHRQHRAAVVDRQAAGRVRDPDPRRAAAVVGGDHDRERRLPRRASRAHLPSAVQLRNTLDLSRARPERDGCPRLSIALRARKSCVISRAMRLSLIALPISLSLLLAVPACKPQKAAPTTEATGEQGQVVATVDSTVITVGDVQERIN